MAALEAMAKQGVLHRDISRSNILCNLKHYYCDENKPEKQLPYIEAMLCVVLIDQSQSLTISSRPDDVPVSGRLINRAWSLVTDLGHSANMNDSNKGVGFERTV
jgi:hypothetical protein